MSLERLQHGWNRIAENRIRAAQDEGQFDELPGLGRPLEEIMDINDPNGWVRRTARDARINVSGIPSLKPTTHRA